MHEQAVAIEGVFVADEFEGFGESPPVTGDPFLELKLDPAHRGIVADVRTAVTNQLRHVFAKFFRLRSEAAGVDIFASNFNDHDFHQVHALIVQAHCDLQIVRHNTRLHPGLYCNSRNATIYLHEASEVCEAGLAACLEQFERAALDPHPLRSDVRLAIGALRSFMTLFEQEFDRIVHFPIEIDSPQAA